MYTRSWHACIPCNLGVWTLNLNIWTHDYDPIKKNNEELNRHFSKEAHRWAMHRQAQHHWPFGKCKLHSHRKISPTPVRMAGYQEDARNNVRADEDVEWEKWEPWKHCQRMGELYSHSVKHCEVPSKIKIELLHDTAIHSLVFSQRNKNTLT